MDFSDDPALCSAIGKAVGRFLDGNNVSGFQLMQIFQEEGITVDFVRPEHDKVLMHCGALTLHPACKIAYWKGINVSLTMMEYRIIEFLVNFLGERKSYREIYDVMRGKDFQAGGDQGFHTNVRSAIKRIRVKFKSTDGKFDQIECVSGFGYLWMEK